MFFRSRFHVSPLYASCAFVFMSWGPQPRDAEDDSQGHRATLTACNDIFWHLVLNTMHSVDFALTPNAGATVATTDGRSAIEKAGCCVPHIVPFLAHYQ